MALPVVYANRRATIARLDTVAAAAGLNIGEAFLVTDQQRMAIATGPDDYALMARLDEIGSGGGGAVSVVAARVRRTASQSIPVGTGWTDLVWQASAYQTGGTFWTSGATVTFAEDGLYQVFVEATFDSTGLLGATTTNIQLIVGGATVIGDDEQNVSMTATSAMFVMAQRYFTAGQTIKAQVKHSNAAAASILLQGDHSPDLILTKIGGAKGDAGVYVQQTRPLVAGPWQWWVKDANNRVVNLIINDGIA
jgi:hypothetical protein